MTQEDRDYLSRRLIVCGDILSDSPDADPSFLREVEREYRAITKRLYPEMFKHKKTDKKSITFGCMTFGCPGKKRKLISKQIKKLSLSCHICGKVSVFEIADQKIEKSYQI